VHCGENSRIFRDAADQTLPVTEFSEIYNRKIIKFSYLSWNIQLQVTFGLLHLGKSGSFRHSVYSTVECTVVSRPSCLGSLCLHSLYSSSFPEKKLRRLCLAPSHVCLHLSCPPLTCFNFLVGHNL
jgi:hypothetical protein